MGTFTLDMSDAPCCAVCKLTSITSNHCSPTITYTTDVNGYSSSTKGSLQTPRPAWHRGSTVTFVAPQIVTCGGNDYRLVEWTVTYGCSGGSSETSTGRIISIGLPDTCECGEQCTISIALIYELWEECAPGCDAFNLVATVSSFPPTLDDDCAGLPYASAVQALAEVAEEASPKTYHLIDFDTSVFCADAGHDCEGGGEADRQEADWDEFIILLAGSGWGFSLCWDYYHDPGTHNVYARAKARLSVNSGGGAYYKSDGTELCAAQDETTAPHPGSAWDESKWSSGGGTSWTNLGSTTDSKEVCKKIREFLEDTYSFTFGGGASGTVVVA